MLCQTCDLGSRLDTLDNIEREKTVNIPNLLHYSKIHLSRLNCIFQKKVLPQTFHNRKSSTYLYYCLTLVEQFSWSGLVCNTGGRESIHLNSLGQLWHILSNQCRNHGTAGEQVELSWSSSITIFSVVLYSFAGKLFDF